MKKIISIFALLALSTGLIAAGKRPLLETRKKTLIITTINSGLPSLYNIDKDLTLPVAKKLQKLVRHLNTQSQLVEYDLLLLVDDGYNYFGPELAAELLQQEKIQKQVLQTDEIIFISLDHSNSSYTMLEVFRNANPKTKVPLAYSSGCFDLTKAQEWHTKGSAQFFIGHIGLSFSPLVYNSLIEDVLRDYSLNGNFQEKTLQDRIDYANEEMKSTLTLHKGWITHFSNWVMKLMGGRAEYSLKDASVEYHVDPTTHKVITQELKTPLSDVESAKNQSQAYLSSEKNPITP